MAIPNDAVLGVSRGTSHSKSVSAPPSSVVWTCACSVLLVKGSFPAVLQTNYPGAASFNRPVQAKSLQSCPTLCDPMDCSSAGSLSMGFSRQEYWRGLPFPSPGDLPDSGMEPTSSMSPALQVDSLPLNHGGCLKVEVAQPCLTLCDPMDYTVHSILQARTLEWVAIPFSRETSQPRDRTQVTHIAGRFFTSWATREVPLTSKSSLSQSR